LSALLHGVDAVIAAQDKYLLAQLQRNGVELIRGKGRFLDAHRIEIQHLDGSRRVLQSPRVLLATGSRPRHVPAIEVDHEHIVDSDSILSLPYLPRSMLVLGSGVIACEYASIFAALGCTVTVLDKAAEPLGFLDPALRSGFLAGFRALGGEYCGGSEVSGARFDGFSQVEVQLHGGATLTSDIVFAAFGRVANLDGIGLDRLGLAISSRGTVQVNERFETNIPGILAAGDAIGPPALACAAADQGRRAALVALGLPPPALTSLVPTGVYTIPEIACVGLSQSEAAAKKIDLIVGRADFSEVARAHIAGEPSGFLTLLCERGSARVLGVQALGEGATELVHLGQAAIATGATADFFIEQIFNFPTMTEAYRIAAFDILKQRSQVQPAPLKVAVAMR
jgi:NAD(P) transhydrogenase